MASGYKRPEIVGEVVHKFDEALGPHRDFVRKYQRGERAYKGILLAASEAAKWRHKLAPPYAHNLIETVVANTVEMGLVFDITPAPHVNTQYDEAVKMLEQAESISDLLRHEHRVDEMDFKQRPLFLCNAIGGRGVGKTGWNYVEGAVRRQGVKMKDVQDENGNTVLSVPTMQEIEEKGILLDHSTCEVIHPCDFVIHPNATSLKPYEAGGAQHLFERQWYSFEQLKSWERAGFVKNVDALKETLDFARDLYDREKEIWSERNSWSGLEKDVIEVLNYWCYRDGVVKRTLIGNRVVLLRDEEDSPFWHGGYPYFLVSSMPQPFSTLGTSEIELIETLQEILWELGNQTLDNVELINNFITLIRSDVDDPEAFDHYPGARWPVDSIDQVSALQPPYQLANVALEHIGLIKGDLQNVTSSAPFAGGASTAQVDNKTATGAAVVMSAAQQRMLFKKYQAQQGLRQEANMRIKNCQQFIDQSKLVHIVGEDGATRFREIDPLSIQGEYVAELEPMGESQMRQEKRAEAMQLAQVLIQAAPMAAAGGAPLSIKEVLKWALKKWGIEDSDRFFSVQPPSMGAMAAPGGGGAPGGGQAPPGPPQPNIGVTAGSAVDASSPSAIGGITGSPVSMVQRALAMGGGSHNA